MFLTPPDVISQVLLAIPMWVLFEVGIIASSIIFKDRLAEDALSEEIDDVDQDDDTDYHPLTDEEMEAELARAEGEETDTPDADESSGTDSKK